MMRPSYLFGFLFGLIFLLGTSASYGGEEAVEIGDDAPEGYLDSITWIKELYDGGPTIADTPVVLEFWATFDSGSKRAIPELTELQAKYGQDQLTVLSVTWPVEGQTESDIKRFVQRQGKRMNFWVGIDEEGGKASKELFESSTVPVPFAFIIGREGRLQFLGHPTSDKFTEVLEKVVLGRYDHKSFEKAKRHLQEVKRARSLKNWDQYYKLSNDVLEIDRRIFYTIYIERFDVELMDRNNPQKAYADAQALIVERADDPEMLGWLGLHIATDPSIPDEKRNLDVALQLTKAARLTGGMRKPMLMALEARVLLERGEIAEAVALQRDAYRTASTGRKEAYKRVYQEYRSQLKRTQAE